MKRALFLAFLLLFAPATVLAGSPELLVGGKAANSPSFQQYVQQKEEASKKLTELENSLKETQAALSQEEQRSPTPPDRSLLRFFQPFMSSMRLSALNGFLGTGCILATLGLAFYFLYLKKHNKKKLAMLLHPKTFSRLMEKIHYNNTLPILLLGALLFPFEAQAKTTSIDDITMRFFGSEQEQAYVTCKYKKPPLSINYSEINGIFVYNRINSTFQKQYNIIAHLVALKKNHTPAEFVELMGEASSVDDVKRVITLLCKTSAETAKEVAPLLVDKLVQDRYAELGALLNRFEEILDTLKKNQQTALAQELIPLFLNTVIAKSRTLDNLDDIVDFANKLGSLGVIKDKVVGALEKTPSRLSFQDALSIAHIYLSINKEQARKYFAPLQYAFSMFSKSERISAKIGEIIQALSDPPLQPPLYDAGELAKALQQQPLRIRLETSLFFTVYAPSLGALAFNSIPLNAETISALDSSMAAPFARLVMTHKKGQAQDVVDLLVNATAQTPVLYARNALMSALGILGADPAAFVDRVLALDKAAGYRLNANNTLLLALIAGMTPQQLRAHEEYLKNKESLRERILTVLFEKDKETFYNCLEHAFKKEPKFLLNLNYPNDEFDFSPLFPVFSPTIAVALKSIPAAFLLAKHLLGKANPEPELAHKALIPHFNALFQTLLAENEHIPSDSAILTTLLLQELISASNSPIFHNEARILDAVASSYFPSILDRDKTLWEKSIVEKEQVLKQMNERLERLRAANEKQRAAIEKERSQLNLLRFCLYYLLLLIFIMTIMSMIYGFNAILPGKNFNLLHWLLEAHGASGVLQMASIIFLPFGLSTLLVVQLVRGLLTRDAVQPTPAACALVLEQGTDTLKEHKA
jgi:hypothetical protein